MGKVYEALTRSEREHKESVLAIVPPEAKEHHSAAAAVRRRADEFDFIDFSLNAPSASEAARAEKELPSSEALRQLQPSPAREASLDITRVDPHLVAFYDFDPRAAEQYSNLAASVISSATERRLKRLLIASAQSGEGRTCVTLNLACALASAGQSVLVIDTDLHNPSVLRLLGLEAEIGVAEAVAQEMAAASAAVKVKPGGFAVLPTRERVENSAQVLASPAFRRLLDAFEADYNFMLLDSSPLIDSGDSSLLTRLTDATLMVIRPGKTYSKHLDRAIAPLSEDNILGVVINRAQQ